MGSVAPLKRAPDYGQRLLRAIQEHALARADAGRESDIPYTCRLLADGVDNPNSRDATLLAVAEYLTHALTGISPDI